MSRWAESTLEYVIGASYGVIFVGGGWGLGEAAGWPLVGALVGLAVLVAGYWWLTVRPDHPTAQGVSK